MKKKLLFGLIISGLTVIMCCKKEETSSSNGTSTTGTSTAGTTTSGTSTAGTTTSGTTTAGTTTSGTTTAGTTSGTTTSGTTTSGTTSGTTTGGTTGGANTCTVDGVTYSKLTSASAVWVNNAASLGLTSNHNLQIWFKTKPTVSGSYTITDLMKAMGGTGSATEVGLVFIEGGTSKQFWSTSTSGGTVNVTVSGTSYTITLSNSTVCEYNTSNCKTVSANFSL